MSWTLERLQTTLDELRARHGDTTTIEVKRASSGIPSNLANTLCAFANMPEGGTIILGVDERSNFTITGVNNISAMEQAITDSCRNSVKPAPQLSFTTLKVAGKAVVVITVAPLPISEKPATTKNIAYLRQADGDYQMQPYELRMLELEKLHYTEQRQYDQQPVPGTSVAELDATLLERFLQRVRSTSKRLRDRSDSEILNYLAVTDKNGTLTLAGYYTLGFFPQGHYPALGVTAAVQQHAGSEARKLRNKTDFDGPVPVMLEAIMEWLKNNIPQQLSYGADGHMHSSYELPLTAIRELIGNALVHRDLSPNTLEMGKSIQIRLTPDALYIVSPGGLRGVSLAQVTSDNHAQAAVNQRVYAICKSLSTADGANIIEGEGGGLAEVFRATADAGLPRPTLTDTGTQFTARLWRDVSGRPVGLLDGACGRGDDDPATMQGADAAAGDTGAATANTAAGAAAAGSRAAEAAARAALITGALGNAPATLRELVAHTGLASHQVRYVLRKLLATGEIVMDGEQGKRQTQYRLTSAQADGHKRRGKIDT